MKQSLSINFKFTNLEFTSFDMAEYEEILGEDDPLVITGQVNLDESPRKFFPTKIETG